MDNSRLEEFWGDLFQVEAAELLRDDLDAMGPTRLSEVEEAQREILEVARRLADSGDLDLGQGGDEYV